MILSHLSIAELLDTLYSDDTTVEDVVRVLDRHEIRDIWSHKPLCPIDVQISDLDDVSITLQNSSTYDISYKLHEAHIPWNLYITIVDLSNINISIPWSIIIKSFPNIETLSLRTVKLQISSQDCESNIMSNLKYLDISETEIQLLSNSGRFWINAPNLISLDLSACPCIDIESLNLLGLSFPNLEELYLRNTASYYSPTQLGMAVAKIGKLRVLDLSDTYWLSMENLNDHILETMCKYGPPKAPILAKLIVLNCPELSKACIYSTKSKYFIPDIEHNSVLNSHSEEDIQKYIITLY
jgi:hypothetical protein